MTRVLGWLLVALLAVGAAEYLYQRPVFDLEVNHVRPLAASAVERRTMHDLSRGALSVELNRAASEAIAIDLVTRGWFVSGVLEVEIADGQFWLVRPSDVERLAFGAGRDNCTKTPHGSWLCRKVWRTSRLDRDQFILYGVEGSGEVRRVSFTRASAHRAAGATLSAVLVLVGLLLALGPALVLLANRSDTFELFVTAAIGASWLLISGWMGSVAFFAFVLGGYAIIRLDLQRRRMLPATGWLVAAVLLGLYFVKVVVPLAAAGFANPGGFALALPLGLSFLAIRLIDLIFAVRSRAVTTVSFPAYLGLMLNPAMVAAGPIMTLTDFQKSRIANWSVVDWAAGVARCGIGVVKKLAADTWIAPALGLSFDAFVLRPEAASLVSTGTLLLLNLAFIFLDFSAFADIAIGAGRATGRRLPENFDWPLLRTSLRSYWQNWHMTLSNWAMRRVYYPTFLETRSTALAAVCSMLAIGLWHYPSIGWVLWSVHHAAGLVMNTWFSQAYPEQPPAKGDRLYALGLRLLRAASGWLLMVAWIAIGYVYTLFDNLFLSVSALRSLVRIGIFAP